MAKSRASDRSEFGSQIAPGAAGAGLFLLTVPIHRAVPETVSIAIASVTLALIGGAYIGFGALAGTWRDLGLEFAVAVLFGLAALAGLIWHWSAIPAALLIHALWDLAHHRGRFGAPVPAWYIPFCVAFDLGAAGVFTLLYAT